MMREELAILQNIKNIIQKELNRADVAINDDGSAPSMYDIRVGSKEKPEIAIEVTGVVDEKYTETSNLGPGKGPIHCSTAKGDWSITLKAGTSIKKFKKNMPLLLQMLESQKRYLVRLNGLMQAREPHLFNYLSSLGITLVHCYQQQGEGKVHLSLPGQGGTVSETGESLVSWLAEFLHSERNKDNLNKLQISGATSNHLFIWIDLCSVEFPVWYYLSNSIEHLPTKPLKLPEPINELWVKATFNFGKGLRWDGKSWKTFQTTIEQGC
jgi:hypothetical protein